jgi:hypothetical protein
MNKYISWMRVVKTTRELGDTSFISFALWSKMELRGIWVKEKTIYLADATSGKD